ncbi:MAG: pyridoxamine 5'-phosphate oxidase family protein [Actinobacteria bacterium]|nr:pyridoxamine 5'-phosphate oxidase family protein [Actinomycetota bacterium]
MSKRRDAIKMTDDEMTAFLEEQRVVNIATIGPDGNIHLVAMWYSLRNGNIAFETFAKSQKVLNLRRDPRITALIEDGEDYSQLRGLEIVGKGIVHDDAEVLSGVAQEVVRKYIEVEKEQDVAAIAEAMARNRVAIEIVPDKVVSWDHNKLGGTY